MSAMHSDENPIITLSAPLLLPIHAHSPVVVLTVVLIVAILLIKLLMMLIVDWPG